MTHPCDPGYGWEPFRTLCAEYPDESVYPSRYFRTDWGPIFHPGRLDNTAHVLVIGQNPAQHEGVVRRILVGEAGRRLQGFLAKLGVDTSYLLVNTLLYSVYGTVLKAVAAAHRMKRCSVSSPWPRPSRVALSCWHHGGDRKEGLLGGLLPAHSASGRRTSTFAAGGVRYSGIRAKPRLFFRAIVAAMRRRDMTHDPRRH